MSSSAVERAVRVARRRLATQHFLDACTRGWALALGVGLAWVLLEPARWWVAMALVAGATLLAVIRAVRAYPAPTAAALEVDSRFGLRERVTAAVELSRTQPETDVACAVVADAEAHATGLRVREKFPLQLRRSAWLVPLFASLIAVAAFVWNPVTDSTLFTDGGKKPADLAKKISDNPPSQPNPFPQPKPKEPTPDRPDAEKLATIRAELDRLEREAKEKKPTPQWVADLTAAEDAARGLERESLDRLGRMEAQLKQLDAPADSPAFKDGPARDAAKALAKGDLAKAEKALGELAKQAAKNPADPDLRKQLEKLKDEIRKAGENAATREKLEKLIEQAKKEGRDATGLEQELERAKAGESKPLKDLADKLDEAAKQLEMGKGEEAAQQLEAAAEAVGEIGKDAQAAGEAQAQADRAGQLRTEAETPGGAGGQAAGERPDGKKGETATRDVRVRVPFIDPKGAKTPAGSGDFGNNFTKTDPGQLAPAIENAARTAPASVAGQPLTPGDRAAVREFFERLGK